MRRRPAVRLPDLVSEAYRRGVSGRPGPVAIALRGDILDDPVPANLPPPTATATAAPRPTEIAAVVDLLQRAQRPLIIAGGGVLRANASAHLVTLAERLGVPAVTGFRRHDAFPNDHPLYIGPLSFGAPAGIIERVRSADVVLAIGSRLSEMTTFGYTIPGPEATLIQVDISPDSLGRTFPARIAIAADAGETIDALLAAIDRDPGDERIAANARDRELYVTGSTPPTTSTVAEGVDPALVIAALRAALPPEAIVTVDAGNYWGWVARYFRFLRPRTLLGPTSGAMGYAVPAAVAAALHAGPATPVVALVGDGGFLMTGNELAVAAQHGLKLTCVVFDNALYGTIRLHQERAYPGRVAGTEIWSPDFVRYAEAFGGLGIRIDRNEDISDAVRTALAHPGIAVIAASVARDTIAVGQSLSAIAPRAG